MSDNGLPRFTEAQAASLANLADVPTYAPTPVPSEVAETTAGEREGWCDAGLLFAGHDGGARPHPKAADCKGWRPVPLPDPADPLAWADQRGRSFRTIPPVPSEVAETTAGEREVCEHPSTTWVDDATGWKCYDCGFVVGHLEPAPTNADEMAAVVRAIVQHHEADHSGPWQVCPDDACRPPSFDLMAHATRQSDAGEVEALVAVLDGHEREVDRDGCICGWSYDDDQPTYDAHLAAALLPLLDRVRREEGAKAWDEGWEAAWSPMSMSNRNDGPNPYRAASVARGEGL